MTSNYNTRITRAANCDINDCCDNCQKDGAVVHLEEVDGNLVFHTETGGAFAMSTEHFVKRQITEEEYEMAMKKGREQAEEHNQKVQNGSLSVDELMEKFNFGFKTDASKTKKQAAKKINVKTAPQPRSKPRILRTKVSRIGKPATLKDTDSQNCNKYNKRFTKTKKPARL